GAQEASFTNGKNTKIDFHAKLTQFSDTRKPVLAKHRLLKRDGALIEPMGRDAHEVKMNVVYVGDSFINDFKAFVAAVCADPTGLLVQPAFGQMQVACQGFDQATIDIVNEQNCYTVPVSFVENNVDKNLEAALPSVSTQQQAVSANVTGVNSFATQYVTAS